MKKCIIVNAYRRPKYLYVCLDALSRCDGIKEWDIRIDVDGPIDTWINLTQCLKVLPCTWKIRHTNLGCLLHYVEMIRDVSVRSYQYVMYMEEDHLLRPDALTYITNNLHRLDDDITWVSLYNGDTSRGWDNYVSNSPNVLKSSTIHELLQFFDSKGYLGLPNICLDNTPISEPTGSYYDVCLFAWTRLYKRLVLFAEKHYSLNFGYVGHSYNTTEFDRLAFAGNEDTWLGGVIHLATTEPFASKTNTPGFVYKP